MVRAGDVREGMRVRDSDGAKLGKVARKLGARFIIEKGFVLPREISARYDQIAAIDDGTIRMRETGAQIEAESYATPSIELDDHDPS